MATDSMDLFGCPYCGFRVRPNDDACPRCGNSFHHDTKFECPFCGDMVPPGTQECPSCHINFAEFVTHTEKKTTPDSIDSLLIDIINLESSQVKKEDKKLSCPKCSWMLDGSEERCPKCGADFREDATFQCPICGAFVNSSSANCPECGTLFAGDEEAADEQKTAEDHEAFSSALTDILSSAGHDDAPPEVERAAPAPPPIVEPPPVRTPPAPEPEPVAPEPEVEVKEPDAEPIEEPQPAPQEAAPAAEPKKTKQRKLKAKPGGAKAAK